ncbi:MAG TPA: orotidine-5'-phosphate decarboxylase [Anaerolineales bacterium]|nr:orotidine-5'-phosphate decarboxylase [Anaerolineales bacterium]
METFFTFLERRVDDCSSLLCVGLDPHLDDLSAPTAAAAEEFCLQLIRATSSYAAAFKPNAAFFEALGPEGWVALRRVIEAIRAESMRLGSRIPVILDAKRGDIASTAEAYARSAFEVLGADAITLSPYLGRDSIEPFIRDHEKGAFILCKTSNAGSGDFQDVPVNDGSATLPLYAHVARLAAGWNTQGNIGIVVGANYPGTLAEVRQLVPDLWFLVPGVGAQGGDLEAALAAGLRPDGKGLLVNVSRGISRASDPRLAAAEMRDRINASRGRTGGASASIARTSTGMLADALLQAGCVQFGEFTLKSGLKSPIYIDLRRIVSHPSLLRSVGAAYLGILKGLKFDRLAAVPYAAIPIAASISMQGGFPMIYPRKETKDYGTRADIEGEYQSGETVVLIDDLATTGGSKFEIIEKLKSVGLQVEDVVVLIDRQSGARESLQQAGLGFHAVVTMTGLLDHWERTGQVNADRIEAARRFISAGRTA